MRHSSRSGPGLGGCRLGELVGGGADVDGVQHRKLRVLDRPFGKVEGVGDVDFGPVRVGRGSLGVDLPAPFVDLGFELLLC